MINRVARWMRWMRGSDADAGLPWRIFWIAFAVRVVYITFAHTYHFRTYDEHFQFGWEAGRIGRALATGRGYADPFGNSYLGHTGATAWLPPLYPLLMAGVFKVFGVYTSASAWVLLTINSALSAGTVLAVWEIAVRCFSRRNAVWSAWLWALYPAAMQYAVRWIWEMTLTAAIFAWVIVLALRMRGIDAGEAAGSKTNPATQTGQTARWILFAVLWAAIALSNSTLLVFLPVCGVWILMGDWGRRHALRDAVLAGLVFLACLAPWEMRNYEVFHAFIPLRGNLGVEAYLGNGPGSNGFLKAYDHPNLAPNQFRLYAQMGEVRYAKMRGALAEAYIHAHPGHFAADCAKRIYFFWAGVPSDARRAV
ncbi:MAG TPA: hypothetical protein VFE01_07875, partial [Terracidiphilus sp.]|nr:hypothetical protein [Terracidiphilus sp.]